MENHRTALLVTLMGAVACVAALFCCSSPPAPRPPPPTVHNTISGRVSFLGRPPPSRQWNVPVDSGCPPERAKEPVIVIGAAGEAMDVLVRIVEGVRTSEPSKDAAVVEYRACSQAPKVIGVMSGQPILFRNGDAITHNVRAVGSSGPYFNQGLFKGAELIRAFEAHHDEIVEMHCDLHEWETAYAMVLPHRYFAVTGADGRFSLEGVPDGAHVLEAWHPSLETKRVQVEITNGEAVSADFYFGLNDVRSGESLDEANAPPP